MEAGRLICLALSLPGLERDLSIVSADEELLSRAVRVFHTFLV